MLPMINTVVTLRVDDHLQPIKVTLDSRRTDLVEFLQSLKSKDLKICPLINGCFGEVVFIIPKGDKYAVAHWLAQLLRHQPNTKVETQFVRLESEANDDVH